MYRDDPFVRRRIEKNLGEIEQKVTKEQFWQVMVGCLLTTRQRSGPSSPVSVFGSIRPFPLRYEVAVQQNDLERYTRKVLSEFGGIRRFNRIANAATKNLDKLEAGLWNETLDTVNALNQQSGPADERKAAAFIANHFKGFGPKQSRNLLQILGVAKYEIPLDSRITR